jgi:hypothetical protein
MTELTKPSVSSLWKNRRRMAWSALLSGVLFPFVTLASKSDQLAEIAIPFYLFVSSVVTVYTGSATYGETRDGNK